MARENEYQKKLIRRINTEFPGCVVLKNDSSYRQGIPDLTIFFGCKYAVLETKRGESASHRPNQDYYVDKFDKMGAFSSFIYPENEEIIFKELRRYFR